MDTSVSEYLAKIGRVGGLKSRRALKPEHARQMVLVREARRAFKKYYSQCFWSFDPNYKVSSDDIGWVIAQLRKNGNREAWLTASKLCR